MRKIFTPGVKEKILKMYASGIKARDITAQTGLNHSGVKQVIAIANKKDATLKQTHEQRYIPAKAMAWWNKQPTKWRQDAAKFLDGITVEEIWEYCTRQNATSMFEDSHDC